VKLDEIKSLSGGGPSSPSDIGGQIDSFLDEELPGADLFRDPDPKGLDETIAHGERRRHGTRAEPLDLQPDSTFAPDTYDRAVLHVQELYRNEGFLHAEVGPVRVLRRACAKHSPVGRCIPVAFSAPPPDECAYDSANLPVAVPPLDPSYTCRPDPAHHVECEPEVTLRIPVKLGPRTMLDDVQFSGVHAVTEAALWRAAELVLGDPVNSVKLEDARRKVLDVLKEEGYFFADAKYTIDPSADHTRARVRFDVVEGEQVIVKQILVHGNTRTNDSTIRPRIALEVGKPYRTSDVHKTRERIATLNVFSTVNVGLEDPYVPQRDKVVIIDLVERKPQSVEYTVGISSGEGIRGELDYTNYNIGGDAVSLGARVRLSYLPDELIFDETVRNNFDTLSKGFSDKRLAYRITGTIGFPEVGLGPLARAQIDGVAVNDLEHDFRLTKYAGIPALYYRPFHELQFALSQSVEHNVVDIFQYPSIASYLQQQGAANAIDLQTLLRFPDGPSHAFAQRFVVTWDRRDDPFNPRHGTFFVSGFEHTDWYQEPYACGSACPTITSGHPLRFTETIAGYIPVTKTITFAAELRAGVNVQLNPGSQTYPDRLFFLGGAQSMRGYLQDSLVPQDVADHIAATANSANPYTVNQVALRGGNLMINPKFELRIPIHPPFSTVAFIDAGNVWQDATYVLSHGFPLRTTAGSGVRVDSPIGALAFDYGVNLSRLASSTRSYEDFGEFHFAIGLF
jgi:outer membrane protein assembly factor BamA